MPITRAGLCLFLAVVVSGSWGSAQESRRNRDQDDYTRNEYRDSDYQDSEYRDSDYRDSQFDDGRQENRRSADSRTDVSRRDSDSRGDSSESWAEWFSSWWDDDDQSRNLSEDRPQRNQNFGLRGFMRRHDSDDDGYLTREELPRQMRSGFDRLDRNGDGYLSQNELNRHATRMRNRQSPVAVTYVWVIDANQGSAKLEDLQKAYQLLTKIDQNSDGQITRSELQQRQQQIASQWIDECFQQSDEDDDGRITREEAEGTTLAQRFDRLDRNSDDRLSRNELQQWIESQRQQSSADSETTRSQARQSQSSTRQADDQFSDSQSAGQSSTTRTSRND